MNVHRKVVSDKELRIIQLMHSLKLLDCTLVIGLEKNMVIENVGKHISRTQWDIMKINNDIIAPFRSIKSEKFSPGFYCHLDFSKETKETDYWLYLLDGLKETIDFTIGDEKSNHAKFDIYNEIEKNIIGLIDNGIGISQFSLLHGDLYNGNILVFDDKYSLIDFEYVRFGPPQLEWAFLLFWDLLVEENIKKREKFFYKVCDDIQVLFANRILNESDMKIVIEVFLLSIICLSLNCCDKGGFEENNVVREGLLRFWSDEYKCFKEGIWRK